MSFFTPPQVLTTPRLRLEPLGPQHLEWAWAGLQNPESRRLTGTHANFTRRRAEEWLAGLATTEGVRTGQLSSLRTAATSAKWC